MKYKCTNSIVIIHYAIFLLFDFITILKYKGYGFYVEGYLRDNFESFDLFDLKLDKYTLIKLFNIGKLNEKL